MTKPKEGKIDIRKSWVFKATQEELDNCICCDNDGKGISCCGFPCPVHKKTMTTKPKKKEKWEKEFDKWWDLEYGCNACDWSECRDRYGKAIKKHIRKLLK